MSEEIRVGTTNVTFHVTAFYPPMDIAQTCVDVPMYVTTGATIGNHEKKAVSQPTCRRISTRRWSTHCECSPTR